MTSVDSIKKSISCTFQGIEGLYAIFVTDRDGVPIVKTAMDNSPDVAIRPTFLAAHGAALEQTSKMGLGESKHMICTYNQHKMVLLNFNPILVTLIGSSDMNSGLLIGLRQELEPTIKLLHSIVSNV